MSKEGFFRRWSRVKARGESELQTPAVQDAPAMAGASMQRADVEFEPVAQTAPHPPVTPRPVPESQARPLPTLDDVALLGPDSDFSAFMMQGVDKKVRALAMKKLFSDPHFNVMDGLDTYIDDYNRAEPLQAALLASLQHTKSIFGRPAGEEQAGDETGPDVQPKDQSGGTEPPQQNDA